MDAYPPRSPANFRSLAARLPDIPRWVEARGLLLSSCCEVFGLEEQPALSFVLRDPDVESIFVIGAPDESVLRDVAGQGAPGGVIATPEHGDRVAAALAGWTRSPIILHVLPSSERLPLPASGEVGFVGVDALDGVSIPDDLRRELRAGAESSPIAAMFVEGAPVAFCYAGSETESLWDVAIDTLEPFRRRGCAGLCASYLIRHMQMRGKQPVWASYESYPPSWQLARKLGFVAVDGLVQFDPPDAVALEVERLAEGQRFVARLLSERTGVDVARQTAQGRVNTPH